MGQFQTIRGKSKGHKKKDQELRTGENRLSVDGVKSRIKRKEKYIDER